MISNTSSIFSNELIESLLSNAGATGTILGKANTMYTAYTYNIAEVSDFDGKHQYYTVTCKFAKIVSKSLEKVQKLYPNVPVNEALHGRLLSEKVCKSEPTGETRAASYDNPHDYFKFGKYTGKKFTEVDDRSYMCWYYNKLNWNDSEQAMFQVELAKRLEELDAICFCGCYFDEFTPEVGWLKNIIDDTTKAPFEFTVKCNLDDEGVVPVTANIVLQFAYTKNLYTPYGNQTLPCSGDFGKSKRVKGKKIRVTKYSIWNNMEDSTYGAFCYKENPSYTPYPKVSTYQIIVDEFEVIK